LQLQRLAAKTTPVGHLETFQISFRYLKTFSDSFRDLPAVCRLINESPGGRMSGVNAQCRFLIQTLCGRPAS
jgi:hypothetical protein